jgi:plasmid replication initiation protein
MNEIIFIDFCTYDLDLFITSCAKIRENKEKKENKDKKTFKELTFKYSELMDITNWDRSKKISLFHDNLKRMIDKLRKCRGEIIQTSSENDDEVYFDFFPTFTRSLKKRTLTVTINPTFEYLLQDSPRFTVLELKEYIGLKKKYSKLLYQNLKQFRVSGKWRVSLETLRSRLSISDAIDTKYITSRIVNPAVKEILEKCDSIKNLKFEVQKSCNRGGSVTGYTFYFDKYTPDKQKEAIKCKKAGNYQQPAAKKTADFPQNTYDFDQLEKSLVAN